jgi:aminopeptidase
MGNMEINEDDFGKVAGKLQEFMLYCQNLKTNDTYLIVNRNSHILTDAAKSAAEKIGLKVKTFDLTSKKPYNHFPKNLVTLLRRKTPKAGMSLFNYSQKPEWSLKELGARIELLHQTIEQIPISWAHSPGITIGMAINGALQCNYKRMAEEAENLLQKLQNIRKLHIFAPRGTDMEIEIPKQVKFDTDCIIVPPNVYGKPGKFGNLPIGEVMSQKGRTIQVLNKSTGKQETQHYPVKQIANGTLVCDLAAGGYNKRINPDKPIIVQFKNGLLADFKCEDPALDSVRDSILNSQETYGLPTVLEEIGIGLNEKARITGNMLEDEKKKGTCHLASGNIRCHVDMLIDEPTVTVSYNDGTTKELLRKGKTV